MLEVAEARALITTSLSDPDLADVIAREESWLARRIGPLTGLRTDTFVSLDGDEVLRLSRPTDAAVVEDASGDRSADVIVRGWSDVVLGDGTGSWSGDVRATYEPTDEDEVKRVLITCVRLTVNESAYASQAAGDFNVSSSPADQNAQRWRAWKSLVRAPEPGTIRVRSTIPFGGDTIGDVAVEAVAS